MVWSSIFSHVSNIDNTADTIGAAGASNCGDFGSQIRCKFQTMESQVKSLPSWNFTPWRTLQIHRFGFASSIFQLDSRPGASSAV